MFLLPSLPQMGKLQADKARIKAAGDTAEDREVARQERKKKDEAIKTKAMVLVHAAAQGMLALGLLKMVPMEPRKVGLLGLGVSAMNCYMMFPPLPAKAKTA